MKPPKKFMLLFAAFLLSALSYAQSVKVKKESAHVKPGDADGYEVLLDGTVSDVTAALVKFLKATGKVKQGNDLITVSEPTFLGTEYAAAVYGITKEKGTQTSVWLGIHASDWPAADVEKVSKALEKMVYDFAVQFYREKIQVQVDESLRAVQTVEKQQARLINENKLLNTKLEDNKREKIQLEKSLEDNKLENETLLKKIEKNRHDQDSVTVAGDQVRKAVELHKERQRKVN